MKRAFVFPGQGAQFPGMGKDLYEKSEKCREMFEKANEILGFRITDIMFEGTAEELKQTKVTQPAVFLYSTILAVAMGEEFKPDMVAGHSLGEFSALVAAGALSFEDGLRLVSCRAQAMQKACEATPSTMAAVLKLSDDMVESICKQVTNGIVVPANYNCPGQIVISGSKEGIEQAMEIVKENKGRAIQLAVGGAFHSPLMEPARVELAEGIAKAPIQAPICPIYQNVNALPQTDPAVIRENLVSQLTSPVKWTQTVHNMAKDGATEFIEVGPGNVLQGLIGKMGLEVEAKGATL